VVAGTWRAALARKPPGSAPNRRQFSWSIQARQGTEPRDKKIESSKRCGHTCGRNGHTCGRNEEVGWERLRRGLFSAAGAPRPPSFGVFSTLSFSPPRTLCCPYWLYQTRLVPYRAGLLLYGENDYSSRQHFPLWAESSNSVVFLPNFSRAESQAPQETRQPATRRGAISIPVENVEGVEKSSDKTRHNTKRSGACMYAVMLLLRSTMTTGLPVSR